MRRLVGIGVNRFILLLVCAVSPLVCVAQQQPGARAATATPASSKPLTVDRIYSEPSLSGRLTRGIAWTPDSKQISFFESNATGKTGKTELWAVDVASGQRRVLLSAEKLESVYPEELEITTAYWWAPDSSAIAYFEMNESKVAKYPLVDFTSPVGEAEEERYPPAGGGNPIVRVFVAPVGGGEAHAMDTGENTDIYIARLNWLTDSKHLAIQRLNRQQTVLDLLVADAATGQTRTALTEQDQYWINISNDLRFLKDGKRFLWSSERSGYRHLYLYDLEGKQLAQITKGEWEVSGVDAVDEAKGVVYFSGTAKSPLERHLYRVSLDGSAISR